MNLKKKEDPKFASFHANKERTQRGRQKGKRLTTSNILVRTISSRVRAVIGRGKGEMRGEQNASFLKKSCLPGAARLNMNAEGKADGVSRGTREKEKWTERDYERKLEHEKGK